jgi:hypothetical protein
VESGPILKALDYFMDPVESTGDAEALGREVGGLMAKAADDNDVTRQTIIEALQQRKDWADSQSRGLNNGQGAAANGRTDEEVPSIAAGYENTFLREVIEKLSAP